MSARHLYLLNRILARQLPAVLLALLAAQAMAQADPPGRIARLNLNEGSVAFAPAGDTEWTDAVLNRPLTQGDRLWTDKGSRAELHAGAIALHMSGQTNITIVALDDHATQVSIINGVMQARLRELADGDSFQLDTPNLSLRAVQAGEYRVDVDTERGTTRVTVHSGTAMAYGENGQALAMGGGQQVEFRGRALVQVGAQESPPTDVFDRWAAERDKREDQSVAARYVPREVTGYQQLDAWGKWVKDPALGTVWLPRDVDAAWIPFRYGRWDLVAPWGWTWIDEAPWGFATSHYGRWAQLGGRWAWVPGRMAARPVYSPALVGFIGNGIAGDNANVEVGTRRLGVAWFPLAPGEAWKPGYKASPVYVGNVNRSMTAGEPAGGNYAHKRTEAVTAIAIDDFQHGRPVRGKAQKLALGELARAQVAGLPASPGRTSLPQPPRLEVARVLPPPKPTAPAAVAAAPAAVPAAVPQVTITREQVQQALQAERAKREQAQQAQQAEQVQRAQVQAQAQLKAQARLQLAKAQREKAARELAQRERQQQKEAALSKRKLQLQQAQAARQAQSVKLAKLQKEQAQRDHARREAVAAEKAQEQVRHEAQVRRSMTLANAEAHARSEAQARREDQERERQQREAQEKLQAQREALQREQQQLAEQRRRDQLERRLQQEAQQRQPAPFIVAPPQGIPVNRGSRS